MEREIKFRCWNESRSKMMLWEDIKRFGNLNKLLTLDHVNIMQFTGLHDKNGKEIYEGDLICWRQPYRTTQTHTGDNIPNGSYTEPMEAGIKYYEGEVGFSDGCFTIIAEDIYEGTPIKDVITYWDLESIEQAIQWYKPNCSIFDDPEEGDLQYLIEEAKLKTPAELIEYLSGVEIIGNIYENPELITK